MAPRTRTRNTKVLKENIDAVKKPKVRNVGKVTKPPRKALADKTNSLSDDNTSIDVPVKTSKVALKNKAVTSSTINEVRPRRERRLPNRYVENKILNTLSSSKDVDKNQESIISIPVTSPAKSTSKNAKQTALKSDVEKVVPRTRRNGRLESVKEPPTTKKSETPSKVNQTASSPFKTPSQTLDSSIGQNRPRRISRLPSKFDDHSVSPNKFIPLLPCHASTPIVHKTNKNPEKKGKLLIEESKTKANSEKILTRKNKNGKEDKKTTKGIENYFSKVDKTKNNDVSVNTLNSFKKTSPDTNNNKGSKRLPQKVNSTKSPKKQPSPISTSNKVGFAKRLLNKSLSFRVFEDRKTDNNDQDIYEFTYDPKEEPKPTKKKRKRPAQKRTAKPKTVVYKNNYDRNVEKALQSLKAKVKPSLSQNTQNKPTDPVNTQIQPINKQTQKQPNTVTKNPTKIQILENVVIQPATDNQPTTCTSVQPVNESAKSIHMSNYASINVEDIAADFASETNDLNYSPVYSPCNTPRNGENVVNNSRVGTNHDPLNLQGNSFFDEQPVASSSMNVSVRHPLASPWRVEFNNLPIKWQANTYVKPNMTPAVESSFITSEELSKKKHVYTNMVESTPIFDDPPALKQTSIISFMKEVAERSLKKKRGRSISPTKANSLFENTVSDTSKEFGYKTPKRARKALAPNVSNNSKDKSSDREHSNIENHENVDEVLNENSNSKENSTRSEKSPIKKSKKKNKDGTFFGFDSENDQENVSPIKNVRQTRHRGLRGKSRILQEVNTLKGPTRVVLPAVKAKLASSDVVEKLYEQLKSAEDVPLFPEEKGADMNATEEPCSSDDDGPVYLFEDIELVHHLKPQRKSYGKAKKVTFRQRSIESDTYTEVPETRSSDEDNLDDLSFHLPNVKEKKVTKKKKPKKLRSKKEEKEADEWAAGFNSMCEDIEEFPLVVE